MRVLDLCCGLGGWSKGLATRTRWIEGIDIVDVGYPYALRLADVRTVSGYEYAGVDVVVASPPCGPFSRIAQLHALQMGRAHPDIEGGLEIVHACLRIIEEAQPRIWIMENVPGLVKHLDFRPVFYAWLTPTMHRVFWGDFPLFPLAQDTTRKPYHHLPAATRSATFAEIPLSISAAFASVL